MPHDVRPQERTDDALLAAWAEGEPRAGATLLRRHLDPIRRFFQHRVGPRDVEDLVQRTFSSLVEHRLRFRGEASFRTYLFGIAWKVLGTWRRERVRCSARHEASASVSMIAALDATPSQHVARDEDEQRLRAALRRLSPEHQDVLELFYWESLSGAEIAHVLGIEPATVRTRLHRARAELRRAFEIGGNKSRRPATTGP